jgi:hypothetical protein
LFRDYDQQLPYSKAFIVIKFFITVISIMLSIIFV